MAGDERWLLPEGVEEILPEKAAASAISLRLAGQFRQAAASRPPEEDRPQYGINSSLIVKCKKQLIEQRSICIG